MSSTATNSSGKTMYRVIFEGVDYGYMTAKARRAFFARRGTTPARAVFA